MVIILSIRTQLKDLSSFEHIFSCQWTIQSRRLIQNILYSLKHKEINNSALRRKRYTLDAVAKLQRNGVSRQTNLHFTFICAVMFNYIMIQKRLAVFMIHLDASFMHVTLNVKYCCSFIRNCICFKYCQNIQTRIRK